MKKPAIHLLSGDDVLAAITMSDTIKVMKEAFISLYRGEAQTPQRLNMKTSEEGGEVLFMPVHLSSQQKVGLKMVTIAPGNRERGLPLIHAMVMVFDTETGLPLAIMDGEKLTALRTGAGAGLATDLLARKNAKRLSLFGTGGQAESQLKAMVTVRRLEQVWVFARDPQRTADFCERMTSALALNVSQAPNRDVLKRSDIICTATTSIRPLFSHQEISPGVHINGIGSYRPDMAEVPAETVAASLVVMDQRSACLVEAGDLTQTLAQELLAPEDLNIELGQIACGDHPGRENDHQITFFKSVGNAVQDLATAQLAYERARQKDIGQEFQL